MCRGATDSDKHLNSDAETSRRTDLGNILLLYLEINLLSYQKYIIII